MLQTLFPIVGAGCTLPPAGRLLLRAVVDEVVARRLWVGQREQDTALAGLSVQFGV